MSAVLEAIARTAALDPSRPALKGAHPLNYRQLLMEVRSAADVLAQTVPNDRPVAIALDNGPARIVADIAVGVQEAMRPPPNGKPSAGGS